MSIELATKEDLENMKHEIIDAVISAFMGLNPKSQKNEIIKSKEVLKILGISPGTLQQMRNNGTIPHKTIGGLTFYNREEIMQLVSTSKNNINQQK